MKRGKRWQVIIRKSGQKPVAKTFPNKVQAEIWARGVETDMDRQTWEDSTLMKEKTVNDVIAAMTALRGANKARKTVHNNLSKDLGTVPPSCLTAPVIADAGRLRAKRDEARPITVMLDLSYLQGLVKSARTYMKLLANMEAVRDARMILKDERESLPLDAFEPQRYIPD